MKVPKSPAIQKKTKATKKGESSTSIEKSNPNTEGESSIPSPPAKPRRTTAAAKKRHALFAKHQERMEKRKK